MANVSIFQPTVIRRHKKTGEKIKTKGAVWWMSWRCPTTRKLIRKSTGTRIKKLARQQAKETEGKLFRIEKGWYDPLEDHVNKTWKETVEEFLVNNAARNRRETPKAYGYSFSAFKRLVKPRLLRDINLGTIESFVVRRINEGRSPSTINKDLRHLKAFLRWAVRMHFLAVMPDFTGIFLSVDESEPVRIPDSDIKAVFQALERPDLKLLRSSAWWRVFLQMALFLGARRGELLSLQWSCVSFVDGSVKIRGETSKSRRDRTYEGADDLVALLKVWFESFDPKPSASDSVLPWPHATYRQLYVDWDLILKAAEIPPERRFIPHNCRSTCVSELLETASSFTVRDWVGHASVTTTEKYYANTKNARRDVAKNRKVR